MFDDVVEICDGICFTPSYWSSMSDDEKFRALQEAFYIQKVLEGCKEARCDS